MKRFSALGCLASLLCLPYLVFADNPSRTQHGGRGVGQVGALTARADDPSAVTFNPAGIARLAGFQLQAGLDFSNATDRSEGENSVHSANHTIQFPPAIYATYHLPEDRSSWAFGIGIDTPYWYSVDWDTALFPDRFQTRETKLRLWELHTVAAYELNDHWSVGGGLRYLFGDLEQGFNLPLAVVDPATGQAVSYEGELLARTDASAVTFDLGVQYQTVLWGWGAVLRGGASLDSGGDLRVRARDLAVPALEGQIDERFSDSSTFQTFELPVEVRTGAWFAPYPELKIEFDLAWSQWSSLNSTRVELQEAPGSTTVIKDISRNWDDTFSLRLGAEGELTDAWRLYGGVALEPSPVPDGTREPGFPRGDATVFGLGASYDLGWLKFDVGYSLWDYSVAKGPAGFTQPTIAAPSYSSKENVWAASAHWTF